jgi:hypothetical protein
VGVAKAASVLQGVYNLTAFDCPFADQVLCDLEDQLTQVKAGCESRIESAKQLLASREAIGIRVALVTNASPHEVTVEYGTPYNYLLAETLGLWDVAARYILTVSMTGMISRSQMRDAVEAARKSLQAVTETVMRRANVLRKTPSVQTLTRSVVAAPTPEQSTLIEALRTKIPLSPDVAQGARRPLHFRDSSWRPRT